MGKRNEHISSSKNSLFIYLFPPHTHTCTHSSKMKAFLFEMESEEITPSSCFNTDKYRIYLPIKCDQRRWKVVWKENKKKRKKSIVTNALRPTEILPYGRALFKEKCTALSVFTSVQQVCGGGTCIKVQTGVRDGQLQDLNGHQGSECKLPPLCEP